MQDAIAFPMSPDLADVSFQALITAGLAVFSIVLFRRLPQRWVAWWSVAWGLYVLRLAAIIIFEITGDTVWLFWHQVATGWVALAILWAALVFSRGTRWHMWYLVIAMFPLIWAWVAVHTLDKFELAAIPIVVLISGATLWTAWVFWRHAIRTRSAGARFVSVAFMLWGLHHLDYTMLRARGALQPWGYFLDILFELSVGIGFGVMILSELATRLEARTNELARLSSLTMQQHEAERRRLSRDLHDETAQTLSAVKLEIGMLREGAGQAASERMDHVLQLVDEGIRGIRRVMNDLRPALLDDLGLIPAIRSLASDVAERSALQVTIDLPESGPRLGPEAELALFRAAQEALANVVRHAGATTVHVQLRIERETWRLVIRDNGRGIPDDSLNGGSAIAHLGLAGMRERITALHGSVAIAANRPTGVKLTVVLPSGPPA